MSVERLMLRPQPATSHLDAAFAAFLLERKASRCTVKPLEHYAYTVGGFVAYAKGQGIADVAAISPTIIRLYLVALQRRGLKDTTQHAHVRVAPGRLSHRRRRQAAHSIPRWCQR